MGNTQVMQKEYVNIEDVKIEDEKLIEEIYQAGKRIWRKYHKHFLNPEFCQNVELAYTDKLQQLSATTLNQINRNLNNNKNAKKFDIVLKYQPNHDEQFIVDQLKEELIDLFQDTNIRFESKDVILNKYLTDLKYIRNDASNRLHSGGNKNNNSNIGNLVTENVLRKLAVNNKNNKNSTNVNKNIEEKPNKKNTEVNKAFAELGSEVGKAFGINVPNTVPPQKNNIIQKENKKNLEQINKNIEEVRQIEKPAPAPVPVPKIRAEIKIFPNCNNKTTNCKLTKTELCQAIAQHFRVRSSIIATIISVLPRKEGNEWVGGFCHSRLEALDRGRICLPPGGQLPKEKRFEEILKYINNVEEEQCRSAAGYYKILSLKEKRALVTGGSQFNIFYLKFTLQLKKQYYDSLRKLKEILFLLEHEAAVNNTTLNELSRKTKDIIDDMYNKCQSNYLLAIIAYLKADLERTQETMIEEENLLGLLEKGLK